MGATAPFSRGIHQALLSADVSLLTYVPDGIMSGLIDYLVDADRPRTLAVTREDEAIAVAAGAYLAGGLGAVLMQSSGFGLCPNALASMVIPHQIPVPMIVSLRGHSGEFNVAQVRGGQAVKPLCDALGIPYFEITGPGVDQGALVEMLATSRQTRLPVCIGVHRAATREA